MSKIIKNTMILFAITLVAGLGLGAVFNITKEARKEQEEKTKTEAYIAVMSEIDSSEDVAVDKEVNKYIKDKILKAQKDDNITPYKPYDANIDNIVLAKDKSGKDLGYIVTVTDKEAYDGSLTLTVGVKMDGTVSGVSFLELNETPGLGMKANDDSFKAQFKDKKVDHFKYTKDKPSNDDEISAISSATVTSNAVTHGVNAAIYCVEYLQGGAK